MYMVVEKKVKKVQRAEVTLAFLKAFWKKNENRGTILFIFDQMELVTLLSYKDFLSMKEECELLFYLNYIRNNKKWGDCDAMEISETLERHPFFTYLILEKAVGGYFSHTKV